MSAPSSSALLEAALRERGLLPAASAGAAAAEDAPARPWFVSALLGFSGWLAGLFGLAFLAVLLKPDKPGELLPLGLVLLGGAYALYRAPAGAFVEQLALAVSIAGHVAVGIAIGMWSRSMAGTALAIAAVQAAWVLAVPSRLARLLSAAAGSIAWALAVRFEVTVEPAVLGEALHSVDLRETRSGAVAFVPALAGWLAAWGPVAAGAAALVATEVRWLSRGLQRLLRPALTGILLALAFGTSVSGPIEELSFWTSAEPQVSWLAIWPLLSLAAALLALGCAHRLRSRALLGATIAGALLHVFRFYMAVGATLLVKSAIMIVVGLLLVAGAVLLERRGRTA